MMRRDNLKNQKAFVRLAFASAGIFMMLSAGGCGATIPDLTDDQMHKAGEYAAMVLLKYDSQNRQRLMSLEKMEEEEQRRTAWEQAAMIAKQEDENTSGKGSGEGDGEEETGPRYGQLQACYQLPEGVTIQYTGYSVADSYEQENSTLAVDASAGNDLLILEFMLNNTGSSKQMIDLLSTDMVYKMTMNNDFTRSQLTTFLDNDLATFRDDLAPDEARKVVLLYEIKKGTNISSITLKLKSPTIESLILIK